MKGQACRQSTLQAATAVLGGLDKGPESQLGNPEVKSLELFTPCAGSQLNELWSVKKKTFHIKMKNAYKKGFFRVPDYFKTNHHPDVHTTGCITLQGAPAREGTSRSFIPALTSLLQGINGAQTEPIFQAHPPLFSTHK